MIFCLDIGNGGLIFAKVDHIYFFSKKFPSKYYQSLFANSFWNRERGSVVGEVLEGNIIMDNFLLVINFCWVTYK